MVVAVRFVSRKKNEVGTAGKEKPSIRTNRRQLPERAEDQFIITFGSAKVKWLNSCQRILLMRIAATVRLVLTMSQARQWGLQKATNLMYHRPDV
jgi:hypothetical protein